jgi:hypothetical protein
LRKSFYCAFGGNIMWLGAQLLPVVFCCVCHDISSGGLWRRDRWMGRKQVFRSLSPHDSHYWRGIRQFLTSFHPQSLEWARRKAFQVERLDDMPEK